MIINWQDENEIKKYFTQNKRNTYEAKLQAMSWKRFKNVWKRVGTFWKLEIVKTKPKFVKSVFKVYMAMGA